jgi:hypothetical protein
MISQHQKEQKSTHTEIEKCTGERGDGSVRISTSAQTVDLSMRLNSHVCVGNV